RGRAGRTGIPTPRSRPRRSTPSSSRARRASCRRTKRRGWPSSSRTSRTSPTFARSPRGSRASWTEQHRGERRRSPRNPPSVARGGRGGESVAPAKPALEPRERNALPAEETCMGALDGIKILELARVPPAELPGMLLADRGADVLGLIGEPGRKPVIPLNLVADYAGASMHGALGIVLALYARERTGRGQQVDVAYLDTSVSLLAATPNMRFFFSDGLAPRRGEGFLGGSYPYYAIYETRDGKLLTIGCTEPWLWENFCKAIGRPELARF